MNVDESLRESVFLIICGIWNLLSPKHLADEELDTRKNGSFEGLGADFQAAFLSVRNRLLLQRADALVG